MYEVAAFTCLWHGLKVAHNSGACGGLRGKVSNSIVRLQVVPQVRQPRKGGRLCLHFVGRARKSWRTGLIACRGVGQAPRGDRGHLQAG